MRKRAAQSKGVHRASPSRDFIGNMPDEILFFILSLLPLKDAVATGCYSRRWKLLWGNLIDLRFDSGQVLHKMASNPMLRDSAQSKYMDQVNCVIRSHNGPKVREFKICFDLDHRYKIDIDSWLEFVVKKQVEILELDLLDLRRRFLAFDEKNYDFPLPLSTKLEHLRKLVLKGVNVTPEIVLKFLTSSPHLETLSIHGSEDLTHVVVGGQALNLKHLRIAFCNNVSLIFLYKFDLLSFSYKGLGTNLHLVDLPKFRELDLNQGPVGLKYDIFGQMASCLSQIQLLSLDISLNTKDIMLDSIPVLPNVKKLKLTIGVCNDNCLLGFASIANTCPNIETLTFELDWWSPLRRKRKIRHVAAATRPHNHLRLLEVRGYYGRMSDLELVIYIIENTVALKQILIDPRDPNQIGDATTSILKTEETARSYAKAQLESVVPAGVELVIL